MSIVKSVRHFQQQIRNSYFLQGVDIITYKPQLLTERLYIYNNASC